MDKETLERTLIRWAKRDYFNNCGRIPLKEFTEAFNVNIEEIRKTLEEMGLKYRFYPPTVEPTLLLIYF